MSAQHTPGPWTRDADEPTAIATSDRTLVIADCFSDHFGKSEANANARLIAAAPEMLAALKRMAECTARWLESGDPAGPDESRSIHEQMVSAIAKAEGIEP